jgi:Tfp pilus assembly protein PilX
MILMNSLRKYLCNNESGSVLLITVLILLFLTILGISALNMTSTEFQITRNYKIYKENLFKADAAVMEAAQRFENVPQTISNGTFGSISMDDANVDSNATMDATWSSNAANASIAQSQYMWCPRGVPSGTSLSLSKSTPHEYFLYGRGNANDGEVLIKIGYRKAF